MSGHFNLATRARPNLRSELRIVRHFHRTVHINHRISIKKNRLRHAVHVPDHIARVAGHHGFLLIQIRADRQARRVRNERRRLAGIARNDAPKLMAVHLLSQCRDAQNRAFCAQKSLVFIQILEAIAFFDLPLKGQTLARRVHFKAVIIALVTRRVGWLKIDARVFERNHRWPRECFRRAVADFAAIQILVHRFCQTGDAERRRLAAAVTVFIGQVFIISFFFENRLPSFQRRLLFFPPDSVISTFIKLLYEKTADHFTIHNSQFTFRPGSKVLFAGYCHLQPFHSQTKRYHLS